MKSLGIDIGSSSIKVVEVESTSKGFQINQFFELPLKALSSSDQELDVLEFLRSLSNRYDPMQTKFCWALPQDQVVVRLKEFPFADRLKINKSLAFELEEDIPFSSENAVFDAKVIRTLGPVAEVLASAAPNHHVKVCLQKSKDALMEAHVISGQAFALANLIERWNEAPLALAARPPNWEEVTAPIKSLNMVLQIGHTRTLALVFEGSTLVGVRTLLWGGKNIAEAVAKKYEITFSEALKEVEAKAFILLNKQGRSFDQILFSETIAKSVREMTRDLQLVVMDFKSELHAEIHEVLLTGGVSQMQGLGPFLTQMIEVPVNTLPVLELYPEVHFERSPLLSAKIGMALGLALEGLKKPRNPPVNFLKGEFARQNHQLKIFWDNWGNTAQLTGWLFLIFVVYSIARDSFSSELNDKSVTVLKEQAQSVAKLNKKQANESGIKKYIKENKKIAGDLKALAQVSQMNSALDIIKKLSDASPAKKTIHMDILKLNVEENILTIEGTVASLKEKNQLQQNILQLASDGKINSKNPTLPTPPGKTAFAFSLTMDRGLSKNQ